MIVFKLLFIAVVYIGIAGVVAWFLGRRRRTPKAKAITVVLTLLVFALIPTWDILPGRLYFDHLCKTEGGVRIYRAVENVSGLYQAEGGSGYANSLLEYGYQYVESTSLSGELVRYTRSPSGKLIEERIASVASSYVVKKTDEIRLFNIIKTVHTISDTQGDRLAVMNSFFHQGNWVQVKFAPLLGRGSVCPWPPPRFKDFYLSTLKPNS